MIAIDTNVLLRYLLFDDEIQATKASKIINGDALVLVTDVVLVETIWVLKGKRYKLDKENLIEVINALLEEKNIVFEDNQTVWRALIDFSTAKAIKISGKKKIADFPDALIFNKAQYVANKSYDHLDSFYSFDQAATMINGVTKP